MTERPTHCPSCAQAGAPVDRITLKALLTADGLRRGIPAQPRFCGNADCPIVYFDVDGDVTFTEADLTVRVYAKHPNDADAPVCYCFGVNAGAMTGEGARELRESIAREVQAQHCACEVKNPKGGCCLGDLVRLERGRETEVTASCCAT
ncbi:MAG TPA: (2Fe-2S)-binding protein [Thermoanaerobaculia bacterium]|nr:(2Fe-2S)-binding protein [Thermoanaerobaculia bacterium]